MKRLWLLGALALLCLTLNHLTAQCTLACNDQVNVSIPPEGFAVILPDMILESDSTYCPGPKIVEVYAPNGANLGDTLHCVYAGQLLIASVVDANTGNYCWGSVLLEDKLPPVITCPDVTVSCTANFAPGVLGPVTVEDNCDPSPQLLHVQTSSPALCTGPYTYILTRSWHATDDFGNQSNCVQTIRVKRPSLADVAWPPHLDGNQAPALSCTGASTDPSNTGYPAIDGNPITAFCKINVTYDDFVVGQCEGAYTILRNWKVLNCCTNEIITHQQIIKVADDEPPVLTCPDTIVVGANGSGCSATYLLPPVGAEDNCASNLTIFTQTPTGLINGNGGLVHDLELGLHSVTYQATDGCQNMGSCAVIVQVVDDVSPVAVCDETTVVSLNGQGFATIAAATFDDGSYDACCAEVTFLAKRMDEPNTPFTPNVELDCGDLGDTVFVIFQAKDCYGNTNSCMVQVFVQDKLPPAITCPADITINCSDPIPPPLSQTGSPVVLENCGIDTLIYADVQQLNVCHTGTIARTFTVTDISGYQAVCTQTITTVDLTPAQYFFPADTMVDCSVPLEDISSNDVKALGDCELFALNIQNEVFQIPCGMKIIRTYNFIEWCSGFDTSGTQVIVAIDTNPPIWDIPFGSLDREFLCGNDIVKPPPPTATDYCTPWVVELVGDSIVNGACANDFTQFLTYRAIDTCGNVSVPFVTKVVVKDTVAPTAMLPDLGPFNCYGDRPPPDTVTLDAKDNCINPIVINFLGDTGDPGCMGTVVRTYRLTDICGNTAVVTQNIIIKDTIPPTADLDPLGPYNCLADIPLPNPAQVVGEMDNCGGAVTVVHVSDTGAPQCSGQVTRTFRLVDKCMNEALVQLPILVEDTIPPLLNCPPGVIMASNTPASCSATVGILVGAVDNCSAINMVTITNSYDNGGGEVNGTFPVGTNLIDFFAVDACGNESSCTVTILVKDVVNPVVQHCDDIDWNIDAAGLAIIDMDSVVNLGLVSAVDLCAEVTYTINPDTLDCLDFVQDPTFIPATVFMTDSSGNTSTCSLEIILHDPLDICDDDGLVVNGRVFTKNQEAMAGVEVQLIDGLNIVSGLTESHGQFNFNNLTLGMSCFLQPYKNDDLLNGVTTYDLLLITKHILGIQPFTSPYQYIAADINRTGTITTFDVVNLRKAILHINNEFPGNTSWRFIRAGYTFPNPSDPFLQLLPETIWLADLIYDAVAQNFVGIKVGDINGSAVVNFSGNLEERVGEGGLPLYTAEATLEKGQTLQLPVYTDAYENLSALQLTLQYDPAVMSFVGMEGAAMRIYENNFGQPRPGYLTLSWDSPQGQLIEPRNPLFYLQFQILESASISTALDINSTLTPAIAYKIGGDPLNIQWRIHEAPQRPVDAAHVFGLAQNRPNPFSGETTIGFMLKQRMPVKLEVMDVAGRKWVLLDGELEDGWHEVPVNGEAFEKAGIYFYQLITPYGKEQRKMVKQ
ncbi:MAG: hypothetical protein R2830_25765 [Saprospiraceae bacterium]